MHPSHWRWVTAALAAAPLGLLAQEPALKSSAKADFDNICARCHNSDGSGYAALGVPSFIDPQWQGAHPDDELKTAIAQGRNGKMPPFGAAFQPKQIDALVAYVREFAPKAKPGGPKKPAAPEPPPQPVAPKIMPPGYGGSPLTLGNVGVFTQHNDNGRTGANLRETILTPANVKSRQFGLLFRHVVDDQVFAQPLYVPNLSIAGGRHNVVIVATAANTIYAFDADRDAPAYWAVNLGPPGSVDQHHFWCLDILGNMGIIGTPVIDPLAGTVYVVALTHEGTGFRQRLHALDLASGRERPHSPADISAQAFDPILENQRPALVLANASVYVGYSSHCDVGPYHGFLFRFDPATLVQQAVINLCPDGDGNSIWQSGQGPAVAEDGSIYFVTSNGVWDGKRDFGDSFLKLNPALEIKDWFTPTNYEELDRRDADLNSSGAMLIPGTHYVMGAGKQGFVYLIDTRQLGHLGDEHAAQRFSASRRQINSGAVYWRSRDRGGLIYLWAVDDSLREFAFNHDRFEPQPVAVGAASSAYPGAMLSVSANGDRDGVLWANAALAPHGSGHINGPGVLRAYDANDVTHELWNSNLDADRDSPGRISKNAPPTVVNGKVYLASFGAMPVGTGALYVYGLLPQEKKP